MALVFGVTHVSGHSPVAAGFRFSSVVQSHPPIPHSQNDVVSCNSDHSGNEESGGGR